MKDKLKIAMLGHKHMLSREGGIEIVVNELATRMVAMGHEVTCYDRSTKHVAGAELNLKDEYRGVRIRPVWTIERKGLAAMSSSVSATFRATISNADIVHIHAEGPAAMSWMPKLRGKRVIVTIHGLDWRRAKWKGFASKYIKWGEKQAVKHADEIIVLSRGLQNYFKSQYGRETVLIPNGVSRMTPRSADEIRKRWGLKKDSFVLFVGRIVPEKGLKYLIEAWKEIKTDKKLVIVGGSSDTKAFMNELKESAGDNVIFTGFQQGKILGELYSNAYIYTLPSDVEGMPLSLLEAMSYGNCCLVSDIPGCVETVEDKAIVFPKSNVEELKKKLQDLIDDEKKVRKYQNEAADYICNKYNWDDVVKKTMDVYQK